MPMDKILKAAALNLVIAAVNIVLFSPGFAGVSLGEDPLRTALGYADIFWSLAVFLYGNYTLLIKKEKVIQPYEIKADEDYVEALKQHSGRRVFENDVAVILEQIERIHKKRDMIRDILLQKFNDLEMSYKKFDGAVAAVEKVFYMNVKSILNKMNAFDEEDYNRIRKKDAEKSFSREFIQTKLGIYNEYLSSVKKAEEDNEEIILKLDKLLLEISRFNSLEDGEIENMSAMKEIDELTAQTKYYRQIPDEMN